MSVVLPINSKSSFQEFRKSGSTFYGKIFNVKIKRNDNNKIGCAFVIKASLGKAVYRNKSRRRVKSLLHKCSRLLLGSDLLFIFKSKVKSLDFHQISLCFNNFLCFASSNKNSGLR